MTDKEKILREMAEHIREYVSQQNGHVHLNGTWAPSLHKMGIAEALYNADYRKVNEREVAIKIFEEIYKILDKFLGGEIIARFLIYNFDELKKKYI